MSVNIAQPGKFTLGTVDASLVARVATLEKKIAALNSGVPAGKVVPVTANIPHWTGTATMAGVTISTPVPVPTFATQVSFIVHVEGRGWWNTSNGASTNTDFMNITTTVTIGSQVFVSDRGSSEALPGWYTYPFMMNAATASFSQGTPITLTANMSTAHNDWVNSAASPATLDAGGIFLFQY